MVQKRWRVRFLYEEPTYRSATGSEPFQDTLVVEARSPGEAHELALQEFKDLSSASSASWYRLIIGACILPA